MPDNERDLIDYHCHLDLFPDYEAQYRRVSSQGIATLAVTTTPRAWPKNLELANSAPTVRVALGLHPQMVGQFADEIALFERYLADTRYVGEVGLDAGPRFYRTYESQKVVFESVVRLCAEAGGKILSVHAVRSVRDVLGFVERHLAGTTNRVVLHWFTGSISEARRASELGCYFSINRMMLGKRDILSALPRQRLLTETDGPFTEVDGHPATPADVHATVTALSQCLALDYSTTIKLLQSNLIALEAGTDLR